MTAKGTALIQQYKNTTNPNIDYIDNLIVQKDCGCIETIVRYQKDFGGFEIRTNSVIDECKTCIQKKSVVFHCVSCGCRNVVKV
jgi:hypothetical protein